MRAAIPRLGEAEPHGDAVVKGRSMSNKLVRRERQPLEQATRAFRTHSVFNNLPLFHHWEVSSRSRYFAGHVVEPDWRKEATNHKAAPAASCRVGVGVLVAA